MKISEYHLGFIGFGHMAQVINLAIDRAKLIPRSNIYFVQRDPQKARKNSQEFGITPTRLETLVEKSHLLILAVRPSEAIGVLEELGRIGVQSKMVVSVMGGIHLAAYQKYLANPPSLLRVMPNIASAIGEGMSVLSYAPNASNEFKSITQILFSCMGEVIEVPEQLLDISTAIAGSGPGFVFRLIDTLARTGEKNGLEYGKALKMAAQAFVGAARLILKGSLPEALIDQIATPNGITEAGFKMMEQTDMETIFQTVAEASARRSKELSKEFA